MDKNAVEKSARLFFALWPRDIEREAFVGWQHALQPLCGGRFVAADNLHATLVFVGEVALDRLESLKLAAEEVSAAGFDISFDAARYWGHNHIVYAAPTFVTAQLLNLVVALEQCLQKHHFSFDQRTYKPHVTLLRSAQWTDTPLPWMPPVQWHAEDFALVQSSSAAAGVHYDVLAKFSLKQN